MSSEYTPRLPSMNDLTHREALIIVAAVTALMIGLVILRFGCNVCIDVCILRDMASARRSLRGLWNLMCPFCRIREMEEEDVDDTETVGGDPEIALTDVNSMMLRLTSQEKSLLIGSILTSTVVTEDDLAMWNDSRKSSDCEKPEDSDKEATQDTLSVESEGAMCSICLHDFEIGQNVSETKACGHVFHGDCIRNWLSSNSRSVCCPYCRSHLITEADVKRSLQRPVMPPTE